MLPKLKIRNLEIELPIIQGGMGIGISSYNLAGNVSKEGGLGVLSSAALDRLVSKRYNLDKLLNAREAAKKEVEDALQISGGKPIGINIMVALQRDYESSVLGSMDGGVNVIISGAGLPTTLPEIVENHPRKDEVALIPIASSGRALELICKRWLRSNRLPDAVIVEGPLAGGHIAWKSLEDSESTSNSLDSLLEDVFAVTKKYDIPVIAAGGIYDYEDIKKYIAMGCSGVQMGTRFLVTHESGATQKFKQRVLDCTPDDIILADKPGSPCKMLFRVIKDSPFYSQSLAGDRKEKCDKGYLVHNGKCLAMQDRGEAFCICNGLLASCDYNSDIEEELYTVGANAYKIDKIVSVAELMKELSGQDLENNSELVSGLLSGNK